MVAQDITKPNTLEDEWQKHSGGSKNKGINQQQLPFPSSSTPRGRLLGFGILPNKREELIGGRSSGT